MNYIKNMLGGNNIKKKTLTLFIVGVLLFSAYVATAITNEKADTKTLGYGIHKEEALQSQTQPISIDDSEPIDEYTWSVMRYDHIDESENFGVVNMPKPTPGAILVPTNMMSMEVCHAAVSLYHEDKMDTLEALEEYDINSMVVGLPYIMWRMWAERNSQPCYKQKASAHEMWSIGERFFWADLVGDCYSQALFNTAVLRLCGFSSEEVFTLAMPMHAVAIVQVEGQWYVFDSVQAQFSKRAISDSYHPPDEDIIFWMENDKYFINFGTPWPEVFPYLADPFSNIDPGVLIDMVEHIVPLFDNSALGGKDWNINDFLENATLCPDITTIGVPYSVEDAIGATVEEKAQSLVTLNKAFIINQTGGDIPNQYDRSLYGLGLLSVEYPQAYANAARFASWTSRFAVRLDTKTPTRDCFMAAIWIRLVINNQQIMPDGCVAFSDFSYLRRAGSSVDQAVIAYGTLRNMKKSGDFWQPEALYVLVTEDYKGYLAVNATDGWKYLNFGKGKVFNTDSPGHIKMAFNEIEYLLAWKE